MRQFVILISMCINGINSCGMMLSKLVLRPIKPDNYQIRLDGVVNYNNIIMFKIIPRIIIYSQYFSMFLNVPQAWC